METINDREVLDQGSEETKDPLHEAGLGQLEWITPQVTKLELETAQATG